MILRLLRVELLKIRRSLVLLMTVACPLAIVGLMLLVGLRDVSPAEMTPDRWRMLWMSISAMWAWFMLPLFVALSTSLINGNEHRNQTWRLTLSLPVGRTELFAAKALVAVVLVVAAHTVLLGATVLGIAALGMSGFPLAGAFDGVPDRVVWAAPLAVLPLLVIHHALSWRVASIVPPIAVGVVATFAAMQIGGHSEAWVWWPWTYPLIATNAASEAAQELVLILAPVVAAGLFGLSAWWLSRREVT